MDQGGKIRVHKYERPHKNTDRDIQPRLDLDRTQHQTSILVLHLLDVRLLSAHWPTRVDAGVVHCFLLGHAVRALSSSSGFLRLFLSAEFLLGDLFLGDVPLV
jgi:hypothetical protein